MKDTREYALYKGEELLYIGTTKEIAKAYNMNVDSVKYYLSGAYKRRVENRKNSKNPRVLILLEDD